MKNLVTAIFLLVSISKSFAQVPMYPKDDLAKKYATSISIEGLRSKLRVLTADSLEGRKTGTSGANKAARFIALNFKNSGLKPIVKNGQKTSYFLPIQTSETKSELGEGDNIPYDVIGYLEGGDLKKEVLVISAHYDHLGEQNGQIYHGADDDGSGTSAILNLASSFCKAKKEGNGPRRSILFIANVGEEEGLLGSHFYTEHPLFPIKNTITDLNIDMVGRIDTVHARDSNYIYVIGSGKLSSDLQSISEESNNRYSHLKLDYTFDSPQDPNQFYYRSDHYNFAKLGIPIIFYFNGVHEDYHKPTDIIEKINFGIYTKRVQLIFYTAWDLANRTVPPKVDRKNDFNNR